jgi:hypothetical protein
MSFLPVAIAAATTLTGVASTAMGVIGQAQTHKAMGEAAKAEAQTVASVYAYNQKIAEMNAD